MMEPMLVLQLALLSAVLAVVTVVDVRTQTIPDRATLALGAGGLFFAGLADVAALPLVLASGIAFLSFFWAVREGHWRLTGRIGMGFGDVKLAGAAGLWLTPGLLPVYVGIAAFTALLSVGAYAAFAGAGVLSRRIPFGPFMALSLLFCWLFKVSDMGWEFSP